MSAVLELLNAIKGNDDDKFDALAAKIDEVIKDYEGEQSRIERLNHKITELSRENALVKGNAGVPDEKITELRQRIKNLTADIENLSSQDLALPIIDDTFVYDENKLIVIKELKPAIYMNSLLEYIGTCNAVRAEYDERRTLVIVVDDLRNELRVLKYHKHGFAINTVPNTSGIFITNKNMTDIQEILNMSMYSTVIVIDRTMQDKCAVNHSKEDIYYLVDSETDMVDFNVNSRKCIGFFNSEGVTGFTITPGIDNLNNPEQRPGLIADCEFLVRVLGYEE